MRLVRGRRAGTSWRGLAGLLVTLAVSETGTRMSSVALPWLVLVTTGRATETGVVAFCQMGPYVAAQFLAGPLLDRVGPRRASVAADLVSAAAAAAIPVLHATGGLPFPVLLALVAVIGASRGPGDAAKTVMVPAVADGARVPLERATGLTGTVNQLSVIVGPAVAGVVITFFGPTAAIAADAGTFAFGAVAVALAVPRVPGAPRAAGAGGYLHQMAEGLRYLRGDGLLRAMIGLVAATNFLDAAMAGVLLPVWAHDSGRGAGAIGAAMSALGIAAVAASAIAAAVAHRLPRRVTLLAGYLIAGAPRFLVLAFGAPLWAVLVTFAVSGFGIGFLNPVMGAALYERIPRHLLGRIIAVSDSAAWSGIPFGGLLGGLLVGAAGLPVVLVGCGLAYLAVTAGACLRREWAQLDAGRGGVRRARARRAALPDG
jgi:MFS family permease